jgi:HD-like signal output (HDOD) protein
MTPQQLISEVEGLFSLPEVYLKVRESINNPKSTINDVALIINQDPNISARILKIANSAFFGFPTEITTVTRAIFIMGLAQLHDIVLATSAVKAFKGISSDLVNMKDFWLHSVFCATIARLLAQKCNVIDSERLFVCGILHDLGHLVIYAKCPTQASKVLSRAKQENHPIVLLEKEILGFDYAEVSGELLKSWKLPASLYETVANHVHLKCDEQFSLDSAIIHIANNLALQEESHNTGFCSPNRDLQALQITGLNEEDFEIVKLEAKKNMSEILKLLFT